MKVEDLEVVVTGAASGIGRHVALALCEQAAGVAALDIDAAGLETLAEAARARGARRPLVTRVVDVSREAEIVQAFGHCARELGGLNALVNAAGIYRDGLLVQADGTRMPLAQWQRVLDVDLTGTFLATRELAAYMVSHARRPGLVVNFASISRHGNPGQGNYAAAKAAVIADTRSWALELAPHGIRVAALSPGLVATPILERLRPETLAGYVARIPVGRLGQPEEIFQGVRFIIECDYFTGSCLEIDGGFRF